VRLVIRILLVLARLASILLVGALFTLIPSIAASAHVEPAFIEPAGGSVRSDPPDQVRIFYRERVEGEYLRVYDEQGNRVDEKDARVVGPIEDPDIDIEHEAVYEVGLKELDAGTYTVEYRVTGEDGHAHGHSYQFRVLSSNEARSPKTGQTSARSHEGHGHQGHQPVAVPETGGPELGSLLVFVVAVSFVVLAAVVMVASRPSR
jgi:methionine-rich copper-binding protein CopC